MRLRVLDDDHPGFAQLAFDRPIDQPTLALSVRSGEGLFLGAGGKWQRAQHFFTALRISGDANSAVFRIGPEIVNYLLEFDAVEFAAQDGSFRVETTWENAVPQMFDRQKGGGQYGRLASGAGSGPRAGFGAGMTPTPGPLTPSPPPEPDVEPTDVVLGPPPEEEAPGHQAEEAHPAVSAEDLAAAQFSGMADEDARKSPGFFEKYRLPLLIGLGVVALIVLAFGIYTFLPCDWPGKGVCPGDAEAAEKARVCAADRSQEGRDCEIGQACIAPYLSGFPTGRARGELEERRKTADDFCQQMTDKARGVFQCIEDLRAQRRYCDIQVACVQTFQSLYHVGPLRADVDKAAQKALDDCRAQRNDRSSEEELLREARQCAADDARKCGEPGCYAAYSHKYGVSGIHKDDAHKEEIELSQFCIEREAKDQDEKEVLQAARDCAAGPRRCAVPRCYADYLEKYSESGTLKSDGRAEASKLDADCSMEEEQIWLSAQDCARNAQTCAAKACYDIYIEKYGASGKHYTEAQTDAADAERRCPKTTPEPSDVITNGRYLAFADAGCGGARQPGITVDVKGGLLSWEHEIGGVTYHWEGKIDSNGNVTARVLNIPGTSASGHITKSGDKTVIMKYPQCPAEQVPLEIKKKVQ